jgi:hypothetical protein
MFDDITSPYSPIRTMDIRGGALDTITLAENQIQATDARYDIPELTYIGDASEIILGMPGGGSTATPR